MRRAFPPTRCRPHRRDEARSALAVLAERLDAAARREAAAAAADAAAADAGGRP